MFELTDVSVVRDRRSILSSISWTVTSGERWVVLGQNGSGKTTLVQLLSTYLTPSSGRASVLGREIGRVDVRELRRMIGYASPALSAMLPEDVTVGTLVDAAQDAAVFPWYIDRSNVDTARTRSALAFVDALDLEARPYHLLASGEQQRVELARALVHTPRALLLDEPMSHLDLGARERLLASLARVARERTIEAIVLVLHRIEDIPPGFTHVLMLQRGSVVAHGPLSETLTTAALSDCFETSVRVYRRGGRYYSAASVL